MILLLFPIIASLKIWEDTGLVLIPNEKTFLAESYTEISINFVKNFSNIENDLNCNENEKIFDSAKYFQKALNENLEEFGFEISRKSLDWIFRKNGHSAFNHAFSKASPKIE